MYDKIVWTISVLFVVVYSMENAIFKNADTKSSYSRILASPLHDDHILHPMKYKSYKSPFLWTPLSQTRNKRADSIEVNEKPKRCLPQIFKNKFALLYTSNEDSIGTETSNSYSDIHNNAKTFEEYAKTDNSRIRNTKYTQANHATSKLENQIYNMNRTLLKTSVEKNDLDTYENKIAKLDIQEMIKKSNTGRYVCYCKEENCPHKSFRKNLLQTPMSFLKEHISGKINPKYLITRENTNPIFMANILQHEFPTIYQENFHNLRIPLINSFPIRQRSELNNIPLLYEIPPNDVAYMTENEREIINANIPLISFKDDSSFLNRGNPQDLHQRNFWQNSWQHLYNSIANNKKNRIMDSSKPIILTNYADSKTNTKADNRFKLYSTMGLVGKNREEESNSINALPDLTINYFKSDEKNSTNYTGTIINPENNTLLGDTIKTIQANKTEIPSEFATTVLINYTDTIINRDVENNSSSLSSMGTAESNLADGFSKVIAALAGCNDNTKINLHYPKTTDRIENRSESSTNVFKTTTSSLKDYVDTTTDPNTKTDLNSNKFNKNMESAVIDISNGIKHKFQLENCEKVTNTNQSNVSSTTLSLSNHIHTNVSNSYSSMIHDRKFTNIEECMKLFNHDLCICNATSPRISIEQMQENNIDQYSAFRFPKYGINVQTSKSTTDSHSDIVKTNDVYCSLGPCANRIDKVDITSNKNLEVNNIISTSTELYRYAGTLEQIRDATNDVYNVQQPIDTNPFSIIKNTHNLTKEIEENKNDETIQDDASNKLLGKSKSYTDKFLVDPNINKAEESNIQEQSATDKNTQDFKLNLESNEKLNYFITTDVNIDLWKSPLDQKETIINSLDSKNAYHFDENNIHLIETTTNSWERTLQEQSTIVQYPDNKKSNDLKISNTTIDFVGTTINKLPFCDNSWLLNAIKRVINSFALDANSVNTKNIDKNICQTESLSQEILQIRKLKDILLLPRIEDTIVEKVKNILSDITNIPRRKFTNYWSHCVIKNTLRNILETLPIYHWYLPSKTLQEHQFKDKQWLTNVVNLPPVSNNKMSTKLESLRKSIKDLLDSPAIASQVDKCVVQNMIVQSVKNDLNNCEKDEGDKEEIDDSIINNVLHDILLETLKRPNDKDFLKIINKPQVNKYIYDKKDINKNLFNPNLSENKLCKMLKNAKNLIYPSEIRTQGVTANSLDYMFLGDSIEVLSLEPEAASSTELFNADENYENRHTIDFNRISIESTKPNDITLKEKTLAINEKSNEEFIVVLKSNTMSSIGDTTKLDTTEPYGIDYLGKYIKTTTELFDGQQSIDSKTGFSSNYNEINPVMIKAKYNINQPSINYYSSDDRILEYIKNHPVGDKQIEVTTSKAFMNSGTLLNHVKMSNNILGKMPEAVKEEKENRLNENLFPSISTNNLNLFTTPVHINRELNIASSSTESTLRSQQTKSSIENNEVSTKIQKIYEGTDSVIDDSSKIVTTTPDYKAINCSNNNSDCNDKNNLYNNNSSDNNPIIDKNLNNTEKLENENFDREEIVWDKSTLDDKIQNCNKSSVPII